MNRSIIMIGARQDGHAGVVLDVVREFKLYDVVGLLDDDASLHGKDVLGVPVLGSVKEYLDSPKISESAFFICSGNNSFREKYFNYVKERGGRVANVIHPQAVISQSAKIADGVFIGANATIAHNAAVGNGALINTAASIDHDNVIEDFANISPGCHTSGRVRVGRKAFLGTGVVIIPDVAIGENAVIGAGSVVIRDAKANGKFVGVPAKQI